MKKIFFEKMTIQNFLSIGKEMVIEFSEGITVITGVNKDKEGDQNGVGKSSILSALVFALYGQTCNDLKKDEIVNNIATKNCLVTLDFNVEENGNVSKYRIVRGLSPQKSQLYTDGDDSKTPSTLPKFNEKIEEILGTSLQLFKQTVIMSLDTDVRFMKLSKPERRTFVENIFNLEIIKRMNVLAKEKHSAITGEYNGLLTNKNIHTSHLSMNKSSRETFENSNKLRIQQFEDSKVQKSDMLKSEELKLLPNEPTQELIKQKYDEILSKKQSLQGLKSELSVLEGKFLDNSSTLKSTNTLLASKLSEYSRQKALADSTPPPTLTGITISEAETRIEELRGKISDLTSEIKNSQSVISKTRSVGAICLACNRPFDKDDTEKAEKQIQSETYKIEANTLRIEDYKEQIGQCKAFISYTQISETLETIKKEGSELRAKSKTLTSENEGFKQTLHEKKNDVQTVTLLIEGLQSVYDGMNEIPRKNQQIKKFREQIERDIEKIETDIKDLKTTKNPFELAMKKSEDELKETEKSLEGVSKKLDVYNIVKVILSDEGFKATIINDMIGVLNQRIAYYLKFLNAPCTIAFNSTFEDTILNDRGTEVSYFSFSGGERRRIDLSCLFAFMDMRRYKGDVVYNISFFDEILDSALSVKGSETLFVLLKERFLTYGESSHIITHKLENSKNPLVNKKIYLEKIGGLTRIERVE